MGKQGKARVADGKAFGFGTSASAFGGFATSATSLSYVSKPPDLSAISDANAVVSLKNLLKKDSVTKAKALEDLVAHVQAHPYERDGGPEEAVLEAWVQLYPRTSIDNSRRVRELAHVLQFETLKSARKRMEKYIPRVVGAWLAGTFDRDRIVSRAASSGVSSFLNTKEKTIQFWRKCQEQILEYASDAIRETPDTLSDERSTTKEDAEAKYYRVVGDSLSLVINLLQMVDVEKCRGQIENFLSADATWALAAAEDPSVRRAVYRLAQVCLQDHPELLSSQLPRIGRALISEALKSGQAGSAGELVRVLTELTKQHPEVWGTKQKPLSRLQRLVEKGSQGSSWTFWQDLGHLLVVLPQNQISLESATAFMKAMRLGISSREEPRNHAPYSWSCYIDTLRHLLQLLSPTEARSELIKDSFYPLTDQYLYPTPDKSSWTSGGQLAILCKAWTSLASHQDASVRESAIVEWQRLGETFRSRMANSLPEVSQDFQKSQQGVGTEGERWFGLIGAILDQLNAKEVGDDGSALKSTVLAVSNEILQAAVDLLVRRNFKPFGAALVFQSALRKSPCLFRDNSNDMVPSLFLPGSPEQLQTLMMSPSAPFLIESVTLLGAISEQRERYEAIWNVFMRYLIKSDSAESDSSIASLILSDAGRSLAQKDEDLQNFLDTRCLQCAKGEVEAWQLLEGALASRVLKEPNLRALTANIVQLLGSPQQPQGTVIRGLEMIMSKDPSLLSQTSDLHVEVVAKLLSLTELSDHQSVADRAISLRSLLDKQLDGQSPLVGIIQEHLDNAGPSSLSVETLVQQAKSVLNSGSTPLEQLFPSTNIWMEELLLFLQDPPNPVLSMTSSLSGAYFLVKGLSNSRAYRARRDRQGFSIPARMAMYTGKFLASGVDLSALPQELKVELLYLLYLVVEVTSDQMTLMEDGKLWGIVSEEGTATALEDFVPSARKLIQNIVVADANGWEVGRAGDPSLVEALIAIMLQQARGLSPLALYSAKALSDLLQAMTEVHGLPSDAEERISKLNVMKATPATVFTALAFLTGFGETLASSKTVNRICNGLVSDVTGLSLTSERALLAMVLLNACVSLYEAGTLPVESRRQVFALKQITTWTETPEEMDGKLATEACKALQRLFPNLESIYGPYWEQAIEYCIYLWSRASEDSAEARLPYLQASLKLLSTLESMAGANDDLDDALSAHAERRSLALIELLMIPRGVSNQPSEIVDSLLCRRIAKIPLEHVKDIANLYGLLASDSREVQTAAFGLLGRALPAAQQQLSVNVLLEKRDAQLPDELLSLLLEPPTLEGYSDDLLVHFPTPVRSYLLTWLLIFDTYKEASFKVRSDYTRNLSAGDSIRPLLEFMFDVLGHSAAHAVNLDREGFTSDHIHAYDIKVADAEPEERSMQWLLIHLFYLTLKYVPGLFKAWYIDCRSKQTKIAVEAWMTKYFSPLVIDETLVEVSEWATKQEPPEEDEKELLIKVSRGSKEVTAGYEVDELQAAIAIRVPVAYPLEPVNVVGLNRVAVSEKKWQSWLLVTQGVITFSNGNIIDGLVAFRRNVTGALKGQTECAICYSIISTDKRMPDKRCNTCKNLFHRTCLYKWFQTSNQNTCPLCRNPIDYLGASSTGRGGFRD